jgi:bacterioferritin-associated ferredoxin
MIRRAELETPITATPLTAAAEAAPMLDHGPDRCPPGECREAGEATPFDVSGCADGPYVCRCLRVTAAEVRAAIVERGLSTVRDLAQCTGAGDGCMACHVRLAALLRR